MRIAFAFAASLLAASGAHAAIISFESFSAGDPVNAVILDDGTTATVTTTSRRSLAAGGTNQAGVFDTNNWTGNDSDLAGPFAPANGGPDLMPGNILVILGPGSGPNAPDDDAMGGTITFNFDRPVDLVAFNFFDTEASQNNGLTVTSDNGDSSGLLTAGDNEYGRFDTPFLKITAVTFTFGGSGGIDGLEIGESVFSVPVPAAMPLLLAGLGMFWMVGRRRRAA